MHRIPLNVLRRDVVLVPQDILLFSDTISNNIRLGNPETSLQNVYDAAQVAQVYDEIMELTTSLTPWWENGASPFPEVRNNAWQSPGRCSPIPRC